MKVILAGNPNTGKTTFFNTLTHSNEHASNWHGVTVDVKSKTFKYKGKEFEVCDLPGLYSLDAYSKEEKIASEFIEKNPDAVVVCMLDANNLRRNLYLALELKEKTPNLILAVNMAKEVKNFDAKKLEKELGIKTIPIDARKRKSAKTIKEEIASFVVDDVISKNFQSVFDIESFEKKSKEKFEYITDILNRIGYQTQGFYGSSNADKVLLSKVGSFVIFAIVMGLVFFITFGPVGDLFAGKVSDSFVLIAQKLMDFFKGFMKSEILLMLIEKGVLGGALSVISFLPQIILLFMCLNFLEDIGYLSRVAFMFDPLFKKLGLTGRSAFSLIMGFGCTTTAVMTSRNLDNKNLQKRTAFLLPYMSCSAKLPIYAVIVSAFFAKYKALIVFSLYMFAILVMVIVALILSKTGGQETKENFLLEMPKYRVPSISKVFKSALSAGKNFLLRVGGAIVISSVVVFFLYNFDFTFKYVGEGGENSILASIAKIISPIFKPLGFGTPGATIAILSGIVAKEMVVSSLSIVNGVSAESLAISLSNPSSAVFFTTTSAISFLVFILLYTPCVSACVSIRKEIGKKSMLKSALLQLLVAYTLSLIVYQVANSIVTKSYPILAGMVVLIAFITFFVIRYLKKKKVTFSTHSCETCGASCKRGN